MPTFYNYTENGQVYSIDDVFVSAAAFRQGNLWSWGYNDFGQLGVNDTTQRNSPVQTFIGGTNWKQVSCGYRHTAAIKTDGTLWTWGRNNNGQLGVNDTTQRNSPVQTFTGGTNWKQVACGGNHTLAIKTDGTLWTWGRNNFGQLGINEALGTRITPVQIITGGNDWKQVTGGADHTAAVKTDGTLWCWGRGANGILGNNDTTDRCTPVQTFLGGANWKQVSCGYSYTVAIKTDGTLWTWGRGSNGALGTNNTTDRYTPVQTFIGGTNWNQVSTGYNHTAAIKTDGTLWIWGANFYGQLGNNNTTDRYTPVQTFIGGTNWKQVGCGWNHSAAIKTDGTLWTWGRNAYGQLGVNDTTQRNSPVQTFIGGTNWKQVAGGSYHTAALTYIDDYI